MHGEILWFSQKVIFSLAFTIDVTKNVAVHYYAWNANKSCFQSERTVTRIKVSTHCYIATPFKFTKLFPFLHVRLLTYKKVEEWEREKKQGQFASSDSLE